MKNLTYREWLDWRQQGLGSSDAPVVMASSPWCSPFELWARKTGRAEPQPGNWAMKRGRDMEPHAREAYEKMTGLEMPARLLEHPTQTFIRASFDGINEYRGKCLEIKCPGKVDHATAIAGRIPEKYLWQCVHLLLVSGFKELDYFSFDGNRGVIVTMRRNPSLEKRLLLEEQRFWQYIVSDTPPPKPVEKPITRVSGIFPIRRSR